LWSFAHELIATKKYYSDFELLADSACGLVRVCDPAVVEERGHKALQQTNSLKAVILGGNWLLRGANRKTLDGLLAARAKRVQILIPDPCSDEIKARYRDEPEVEGMQRLHGLAWNLLEWWSLKREHPHLQVKAYRSYPVAMVTIYDDYVYFGPVLHKRRNIENLTTIYLNPSKGANLYVQHFINLFDDSSNVFDLSSEYVQRVKSEYHLADPVA
jgi:hypothetical protein